MLTAIPIVSAVERDRGGNDDGERDRRSRLRTSPRTREMVVTVASNEHRTLYDSAGERRFH